MEKPAEVPVSPAVNKKLKQSRLPFQILSATTPKACEITSKKRRLSTDEDVTVVVEPEAKENREDDSDVEIVDDEVTDRTAAEDHEGVKSDEGKDLIKIKLPFGSTKKKAKLEESKAGNTSKKRRKSKSKSVDDKKEQPSQKPEKREASPLPVTESVKKVKTSNTPEASDEDGPLECTESLPTTSSSTPEKTPPNIRKSIKSPLKIEGVEALPDSSPEKSPPKPKSIEIVLSSKETSPEKPYVENLNDSSSTPHGSKKKSHKKLSEAERLERDKRREEIRLEKLKKLEEDKQQRAAEREEKRLKEKAEREAVKQKEREAKEQQRLKEKAERDAKLAKEREEKEAQKREKDRKRQEEVDAKNEEKRKKDEERLKKEEEKKQKEEEQRKRDEEKQKKERKTAEMFQKFFVKKSTEEKRVPEEKAETMEDTEIKFIPFQMKQNMRIAPLVRHTLNEAQKSTLETILKSEPVEEKENLYISQLKSDNYTIKTAVSTWPIEDDHDEDIKIIDNQGEEHELEHDSSKKKRRYRVKYLKFHENRRPAYYGTWRKKSQSITARKPLGTDTKYFDYDVDSDLEWEEEGEGESLHGSDDEKEKDTEDEDYEVDNDFFVPHGHLSDDEVENEDEIVDNSPEAQKARLKVMQQEFAAEMKKKTEKLKPRLVGCNWMDNDAEGPVDCSLLVWSMLQTRAMLYSGTDGISINWDDPVDEQATAPATPAVKRAKITDHDMPDLIRLVHGNLHSRKFLTDEFAAFRKAKYGEQEDFLEIMHVGSKIKEIAEYRQFTEEGMEKHSGWIVKPEILEKFQLTDLPLPNAWEYTLEPKRLFSNEATPVRPTTNTRLDDNGMRDLIRLVHGNPHSRKFLVGEFAAFRKSTYGNNEDFQEIKFIGSKIKSIAEWKQCVDGQLQGKFGWWVKPDILEKYNLDTLVQENTWKYTLEVPKRKSLVAVKSKDADAPETPTPSTSAGNIQKFAKVLTEQDKKKQFEAPVVVAAKKRVPLLMSVACGETIPEAKKNTLISQFLNKPAVVKPAPMETDEVITLDDD